jgi:F-type H+-transporting ATPase subunit alpha
MEAFSKFGGDLDAATKNVLDKGARNVEILKQGQYEPMSVEKQVAIIYLGTQGLITSVPVRKVKEFEEHLLLEMENKMPELLADFKKGNLPEEGLKQMVEMAKGLMTQYK